MPGKLLGIAGSLRNVVSNRLSPFLIKDLKRIDNKQALLEYLRVNSTLPDESEMHLHPAITEDMLGLYHHMKEKNLKKGMSNSEVALAAALWAAHRRGADISYLSLLDHFPASRKSKKLNDLMNHLKVADAMIVASPVYFGDRGSLVQELVNMIRRDDELTAAMKGKLYGGIAVGAKRNGGQETTLIYQILDMISLGFLAMGNDSDTTAQYGGTCCAGNVGSAYKDDYGMNTAMGVGRRLANLLSKYAHKGKLMDKVRVLFIILQDSENLAKQNIIRFTERFSGLMEPTIVDATDLDLIRCLACDVCPDKVDVDEIYRCRVADGDDFCRIHSQLLDHDAIVPVAVSMKHFSKVKTNYQVFIERTRYLRRGDYVLSDTLLAPLVLQEVGSMENLHIRLVTSFIRHHTVVSKLMTGYLYNDTVLNFDELLKDFEEFLLSAKNLAVARLSNSSDSALCSPYNPVGYVLSATRSKAEEDELIAKRRAIISERMKRIRAQSEKRVLYG